MLSIVDWNQHYENNRTRELKHLSYVLLPNKQDGDGYTELMEHPQGAALLGAWVAILQVASKCECRGVLARSGTMLRDSRTLPHDPASLSRITRIPQAVFEVAIPILIQIGWLEDSCENPAVACENPAPTCGVNARARTELNRTELNRTDGNARVRDLSGWTRFEAEYPGLVTEMDCRIWLGIVETPDDEALLFRNLPLWKSCDQWRDVKYIPKAENFLSKRLWKKPPPKSTGREVQNSWPDAPRYAKGDE